METTEKRMQKTPAESAASMVQIVGGADLNGQMILFGGTLLGWMDVCATYAARRHAGSKVVTVRMEDVEILDSARPDEGVLVEAKLIYAGKTSMEVLVTATKELYDGTKSPLARARVLFVALGEDRRPRVIPELVPQSEEERKLFEASLARHQSRKKG